MTTATLPEDIRAFIAKAIGQDEFDCLQLAGDASTRKYYRVAYDDRSLVLMYWDPFEDSENYPFLNVLSHFAKAGIRVPKVEAVGASLGVVLLEDLGDLTLERKFWENQNQELALPYYEKAVDEIIKIHYLASRETSPQPICQRIQFDTAKFMWEMNYAREHFLEKVGNIQLTNGDSSRLQTELLQICETLDQQPKFVCHRDYHSRNLMLKLGKIYVIDFQDARLGPIQYDLVSLVHDSYVHLSDSSRQSILQDYLKKAKEIGPSGCIRSDFEEIFLIQTIQRCFKACGSFASFFNARRDTRYLKYIARTVQLVAAAVEESGKFPVFLATLRRNDLLHRDYEKTCVP